MDFSNNDFLTAEIIRDDVVAFCGDRESKLLPPGRYMSAIQRGIEELSFDTFFNKKRIDIPVPQDCLHLDLPEGTFSVKEVYAYNGSSCNPATATKLWYKANYYAKHGPGFFAKNRGGQTVNDPFYPSQAPMQVGMYTIPPVNVEADVFYYSVENGVMYISSNVKRFQFLHIVAHGTTCPIGEVPLVPPIFRDAVTDFACEYMLRELMALDPQRFARLHAVYYGRLDYNGFNGSWYKAKIRVNRMSKGQRADFHEYMQRWSW